MIKRALTLLAMGSLLVLAACRSAPVMNVVDAPVTTARSAQQVEQAIVAAGTSLAS